MELGYSLIAWRRLRLAFHIVYPLSWLNITVIPDLKLKVFTYKTQC